MQMGGERKDKNDEDGIIAALRTRTGTHVQLLQWFASPLTAIQAATDFWRQLLGDRNGREEVAPLHLLSIHRGSLACFP